MFNAIQEVKYYALYYTWSEVLCSFIAIHGVKLYAQCYTRSEAICSLLCKE